MKEFKLIAKTLQGLEEVLAREVTELGATDVETGRRMVSFTGDRAMMYRANYRLRTALRILMPVATFRAADPDEVYRRVKAVEWEKYLTPAMTFAVDAVVYSDEFSHSKFVAYRVKDAIADRFREKAGERPNVSIARPDVRINFHVAGKDCTVSLDSSGDSLHLRGYRAATVEAPLSEVLAAGIVQLSGWDRKTPIVDPFCGSGTLLVEAAMWAMEIPAGKFRKHFGFQSWLDYDPDLWDIVRSEGEERDAEGLHLYGFDLKRGAIEASAANARAAGVDEAISLRAADIQDFQLPAQLQGTPILLLTNPPYGERLRPERLLPLYETLGRVMKQQLQGSEAWIISMHKECFDALGLRPSFRVPLDNGALPCELRKYQMFSGRLNDFLEEGGVVKTDEERRRMGEKGRFKQRKPREERENARPLRVYDRPSRFDERRGKDDFRPRREKESGRRDDLYVEDEDFTPEYARLRALHRNFQAIEQKRQHREERRQRFEEAQKGEGFTGKADRFKGKGGGFKGKPSRFKGKGEGFKGKPDRFKGSPDRFKGSPDRDKD